MVPLVPCLFTGACTFGACCAVDIFPCTVTSVSLYLCAFIAGLGSVRPSPLACRFSALALHMLDACCAVGFLLVCALWCSHTCVPFCVVWAMFPCPHWSFLQHLQYMSPFWLGRFVPLPCTAWVFSLASPWPITYWHCTCFFAWLLRLGCALPPMWSGFLVSRSSYFIDGSIRWSPVSRAVALVSGMVLFSWSGLHVPDPATWFAVCIVWEAGRSALLCSAWTLSYSYCNHASHECFTMPCW